MSAGRLQLEILEGDRVTDTRAFAGTVIEIGKLSKSDLQITDENISRRHAKIEIDADGIETLLDTYEDEDDVWMILQSVGSRVAEELGDAILDDEDED